MGIFDSLTIRSNGDDIFASWFNDIRTILIGAGGEEEIKQTSFSLSASQTNTIITSLIFDKTKTESVTVQYTIQTATLFEKGSFNLIFDGTVWSIHDGLISGDDSGITFDVNTSTGQVDYTSGAETGTLEYKASTFDL